MLRNKKGIIISDDADMSAFLCKGFIEHDNDCAVIIRSDVQADKHKAIIDKVGSIDFVIFDCIMHGSRSCKYLDLTREEFIKHINDTVYSYIAVARDCSTYFNNGASCVYITDNYKENKHNINYVLKEAMNAVVMYLSIDLGMKSISHNGICCTSNSYNHLFEEILQNSMFFASDMSSCMTTELFNI